MVALATSRDLPELAPDDRLLLAPLARAGIDARIAIWTDEAEDWSRYQQIVVRSCWDYHDDLPRWLDWIERLERSGMGARLHNAPPVLRWNARKTYLTDLASLGVPIVPTRWLDGRHLQSWEDLREGLMAIEWDDLVCKPSVSAGALGTFRLRRSELVASGSPLAVLLPELVRRAPLMVQPFIPEIATLGEWSLVFFSGGFSHAVVKRPAAGDFRVQDEHGGTFRAVAPPLALIRTAELVLVAAAAAISGTRQPGNDCLYARVDLVEAAAGPLLVELELIEPALFLDTAPACLPTLTAEIARRLGP